MVDDLRFREKDSHLWTHVKIVSKNVVSDGG